MSSSRERGAGGSAVTVNRQKARPPFTMERRDPAPAMPPGPGGANTEVRRNTMVSI